MQTYTIYFIRHGAVDESNLGRYIGTTDVGISAKGRSALMEISESFGYPDADRIYSSPLRRCTESCGVIYPGREIKTLTRRRRRRVKAAGILPSVYAGALKE